MTRIVADIGGTHARFAVAENTVLREAEKMAVADFSAPAEALAAYCKKHGIKEGGFLSIATAARQEADGLWRFTNNEKWIIDPTALTASGWSVQRIVNDFAASARGIGILSPDDLVILKTGIAKPDCPKALIGPGTGLGLAYVRGADVQETFGGHMLAAAHTDEQARIVDLVRRLNGDIRDVVFEDLASGRGLPVLYRAVCLHDGRNTVFASAAEIIANPSDPAAAKALRLFHEFLGLFAHNAVLYGHGFEGLYLDGGLMHRLYDSGLLDFTAFERELIPKTVPVVREALAALPIVLVRDPFIALRGLTEMMNHA